MSEPMVPRADLVRMEDERDAALLDVEGQSYLIDDMREVLVAAQAWRVGRSRGYSSDSPIARLVAAVDAFNERWKGKQP